MKTILTTFILTFLSVFSYSQTIFPDDIQNVITDEDLADNEILKFNGFYLTNLNFGKISDTLYSNSKTKEKISLSASKHGNKIYGTIGYLTIGNHWADFEKNLSDFNITNITANKIVAEYKKYKDYKIEILKDSLIQKQKFNFLKFSFSYEKNKKPDKALFPIKRTYPFQYSVWYFDYKLIPKDKDIYYRTILFTKERTNNQIEFLDKKNMVITYLDENNKLQKIKGTYQSSENGVIGNLIYSSGKGPSIGFVLEASSLISKKLFLHEPVTFSKYKTKDLIEFMFDWYYDISKNEQEIVLNSKIVLNRPEIDIKY